MCISPPLIPFFSVPARPSLTTLFTPPLPFPATITLNDVTDAGLILIPSANAGTVNCTSEADVCAWASLQFNDPAKTWVNASLALTHDSKGILLSAEAPQGSTQVVASSYAWGAVPFMTVYLADRDLPVRAWLV